MKKMCLSLLLLITLFFASAADDVKSSKMKSSDTSPHVQTNIFKTDSSENPNNGDQSLSKDSSNGYLMALEVRKQYVNEGLNQVLLAPVNCFAIVDDTVACTALEEIYSKVEKASTISNYITDTKVQTYGRVSPERELAIQEATIGHICFDYPNKSTILALGKIKDNYPCTETAAVAMLKIARLIAEVDYLGFITIDGKKKWALDQEYFRVNRYIIDNYPNTWEAETALLGNCSRENSRSSLEYSDCWLHYISFFEGNNSYSNASYLRYIKESDPEKSKQDFLMYNYSQIGHALLDKCDVLARKGLKEKGAVPSEAIDYYNKYFDVMERFKLKHPYVYAGYKEGFERAELRGFYHQTCVSVIEEKRPDVIRESDLPKPKPKEQK